jgi:uncharacterized Zn-binding protein involved in type VI secretion
MIMPPAARIGDKTAKAFLFGQPVALNVLIGGKPAWMCCCVTLRDKNKRPAPPNFAPGIVKIGSKTVIINGLFAARMSDIVEEDKEKLKYPITEGCTTVLIG